MTRSMTRCKFAAVLTELLLLVLPALPCAAQTIPVHCDIGYEGGNPTNRVVLTWEAIPTKLYNVMASTALVQQPWQTLNPSPLYASNNLVRYHDTNSLPVRFYKVVKLDTDPPEVWRYAPAASAVAVARQSSVKAYFRDETSVDPASIAFTIGTNPVVTLADARLAYINGVLTYTPGTNEFLGTNTQTVSARVTVSDTLGNRATNWWSFQLEQAPILADNAVLIGSSSGFAGKFTAASGLTLLSTNGDIFVFSYTGSSSGLSNGCVLVSTDTNFLYKRKVLSLTDDPVNHIVSLVTTPATLAECVRQGSIRLVGDFAALSSGLAKSEGRVPSRGLGATIPLDGTLIYDNGTIRVEVTDGQITFDPDFTVSGEFQNGRLVSFDSEVSGTVGLNMTLRGIFQATGDWDGSKTLGTPIRKFQVLGLIGFVPVWVEAVLEFDIGYEAHAESQGSVTCGFESSSTFTFGARLRNGQWSDYAQQNSGFIPYPPAWQINGAATMKGYVKPKLTVYLESLAGPSADLKPYLEVEGTTCVQPGQAGVDLSLYAGLSSQLAIEVRGWDAEWGNLPSWELFNLRGLIWHKNLATPIDRPPQTLDNMAWIPCGTFMMGSPDVMQRKVTLSQGFWMGRYEVTQGEYLSVMGSNPSWFIGIRSFWDPTRNSFYDVDYGTDLSRPVEQVTLNDAVAYCAALTTREWNVGRLPAGYVYRLPTQAEWEYACRAGTTTRYHYGDALRSGMANFSTWGEDNPPGVYLRRTTSVGSYSPNAWGLYDMHGNVWEWCQEFFPQVYMVRGGCLDSYAYDCGSAFSFYYDRDFRYWGCGFRVVLAPRQP
jgi:formylglycine-generating enzyme required for sulfatase activity